MRTHPPDKLHHQFEYQCCGKSGERIEKQTQGKRRNRFKTEQRNVGKSKLTRQKLAYINNSNNVIKPEGVKYQQNPDWFFFIFFFLTEKKKKFTPPVYIEQPFLRICCHKSRQLRYNNVNFHKQSRHKRNSLGRENWAALNLRPRPPLLESVLTISFAISQQLLAHLTLLLTVD